MRLFFQRARGTKPVVLHVEPDLWGYIEQDSRGDNAATVPAVVPGNLPQTAAGFAQELVRLRDLLAPNVILAYHMSGWGTKHDILYEKPPNATVRAYAARSAAFYRSLGAHFDIAFEDFSDRDAGYYQLVENNPNTWFKPADFARHLLYAATFVRLAGIRMVAWQIPLGNTVMRAENNTSDHYQDNRVQWLLGPASRAHLPRTSPQGFAGVPVRPRRRRQYVRVRRRQGRHHEPGAGRRQHRALVFSRRRRRLLEAPGRAYYKAGAIQLGRSRSPALSHGP